MECLISQGRGIRRKRGGGEKADFSIFFFAFCKELVLLLKKRKLVDFKESFYISKSVYRSWTVQLHLCKSVSGILWLQSELHSI